MHTPLTAHLILDALKLHATPYNPDPKEWDAHLLKLTDHEAHDIGYLSFVEAMVSTAPANMKVYFGHEVTAVNTASSEAPLVLSLGNGGTASVAKLIFNVPQRPLLRILAASPDERVQLDEPTAELARIDPLP